LPRQIRLPRVLPEQLNQMLQCHRRLRNIISFSTKSRCPQLSVFSAAFSLLFAVYDSRPCTGWITVLAVNKYNGHADGIVCAGSHL
jgi:hypothetical protein